MGVARGPCAIQSTIPTSRKRREKWGTLSPSRRLRDRLHVVGAVGYPQAANTEAKLLMLTHAFESWQVLRVCLHADARNQRSRAAIERIGGKFEGILRAHRMAADSIARDSARYSIVAAEWPAVKEQLRRLLDRHG